MSKKVFAYSELVKEVSQRVGTPAKSARAVLDAAQEVVAEKLAAHIPVAIVRFGTFRPVLYKARVVIDPNGNRHSMPPFWHVKFIYGAPLKNKINENG